MTQITTQDQDDCVHPADILINVIVTLLAPMFLMSSDGDIGLARAAALETIRCYRVQNQASLITVGNIIAFGLATLGSLSLSMADDLGIPLVLRRRSNANALDRSANRNERALQAVGQQEAAKPSSPGLDEAEVRASVAEAQQRAAELRAPTQTPAPQAGPASPQAGPASPQAGPASPQAGPASPPPTEPVAEPRTLRTQAAPREPSHRSQWAAAMAQVAAEEMAEAAKLPPAHRKAYTARASILSSTANTLLCGGPGSPAMHGDPW
jgi:hypothetical protein